MEEPQGRKLPQHMIPGLEILHERVIGKPPEGRVESACIALALSRALKILHSTTAPQSQAYKLRPDSLGIGGDFNRINKRFTDLASSKGASEEGHAGMQKRIRRVFGKEEQNDIENAMAFLREQPFEDNKKQVLLDHLQEGLRIIREKHSSN